MLLLRFLNWLESSWNDHDFLGALVLFPPLFAPVLLFVLIMDAFFLIAFFIPRAIRARQSRRRGLRILGDPGN